MGGDGSSFSGRRELDEQRNFYFFFRAEGIRHKKNEIFLDVVEKLNLLVCQIVIISYICQVV